MILARGMFLPAYRAALIVIVSWWINLSGDLGLVGYKEDFDFRRTNHLSVFDDTVGTPSVQRSWLQVTKMELNHLKVEQF